MRNILLWIVMASIPLLGGCCTCSKPMLTFPEGLPVSVSPINLIANPDLYDDVTVYVTGWISVGLHHRALHYSSERAEFFNGSDSVWLKFAPGVLEELEKKTPTGCYVAVKGRFDKDNHGHMGLFPGAIVDIQDIEIRACP